MTCTHCSKLTFSHENLGRKFCKFCNARILEENTIYASGAYKKKTPHPVVSTTCNNCQNQTFYLKGTTEVRCNSCGTLVKSDKTSLENVNINDKATKSSSEAKVSNKNNLDQVNKRQDCLNEKIVTKDHKNYSFLDEINPFNPQFLLVVALALFFFGLANDHGIPKSLILTIATPVLAAVIWVFTLILRFVIASGYEEGRDQALRKGYGKKTSIIFGILGIVFFIFLFG